MEKIIAAAYKVKPEFEYKGVFYQLRGKMEKEDFYKIIKNLKFY